MHRYEHCGLRIASDRPLHELDPVDVADDFDVRVVWGDAGPEGGETPALAVTDGECRVWFPETGHYEVREGREIVVRPRPGAEPARVTLFLLGTVWAALLHQHGSFAFHAGVVAVRDEAIAFCGPRGAGKSSTVAWLVAQGHGLVSDDLTRLDVGEEGPPLIWPSAPRLKLSPEAVGVGDLPSEGAETPQPDEKLHVRWAGARATGPLPLRAIYVLAWGNPRVSRFTGREAVEALLGVATYRPQLLDHGSALARHWRQCMSLAQRVPVTELRRPRDWTSMLPAELAVQPGDSPVAQERVTCEPER
jgi:hypothetical protein